MRVHDVEALGAAAAQLQRGAGQRRRAGRELVQLDVEPVEAPAGRRPGRARSSRARGGRGRGACWRPRARARPPTVALWNDGPRGKPVRQLIRSARAADRRVRLGRRRADGAARAARAAAARGLPVSGRHGALSLRRALARGAGALLGGDRRGAAAAARTKLLVVACNSATAAALPSLRRRMLETTLGVDVLGVVRPEASQAVAATRTGRIGLLATPTTVASRAYEEAVQAIDPHVTLYAVPCPGWRRSSRRASSSTSAPCRRCARRARRCARPTWTR